MKEKILEEFRKTYPKYKFIVGGEEMFSGINTTSDDNDLENFISQALDEYADWKIKECLKEIEEKLDKRRFETDYLVGLNYASGVMTAVLNDSLSNKDKK